ncbi:Tfp pilus assembly protein PilF [Sphingomonas sp. BE123]|uniref:tetratricopeptide repeat protein n=1 Tax=Sphingomonas sp. BE123 TaxID=2817842 RepID=UPI0028616718|nr:tetratricopeptide repeat protein [Sphingomonas sp. BE123]MDR6851282.1 Tfp pilus assembly protein PilF [Sphingomonas sp. BE123]
MRAQAGGSGTDTSRASGWHSAAAHAVRCIGALALAAVLPAQAQTAARVPPSVPAEIVAAGDFATGHRLVGQQLATCLQTAPRADACLDLIHAMVNLSLRIGRTGEAEAHARRALTIAQATAGPDSRDVARAQLALATALGAANQLRAAYDAARRGAAGYQAALGADHPDTVDAHAATAEAAWALGLIEPASRSYKTAIEAAQSNMHRATVTEWAHQRPGFARLYNDYANFLREIGYPAAAEPFAREAARIWRDALGPDHPDMAVGHSSYGLILTDLRRHDEAALYLRESLRIRRLNRQSPDALLTGYNNLAVALDTAGDRAGAVATLRAALALIAPDARVDPLLLATLRANLGGNLLGDLRAEGALREAATQLELARAAQLRLLPPAHPDRIASAGKLASAYARLGRRGEAAALFDEALAGARTALGVHHVQTLRIQLNLAHFHLDGGRAEAARPLYRTAQRALLARLTGPDPAGASRADLREFRDGFAGQVEAAWTLARR